MSAPHAVIARPSTIDELGIAYIRDWAARIRDREPPYQEAPDSAVGDAGALCNVLFRWDEQVRKGLRTCGCEESTKKLLEKLHVLGFVLPLPSCKQLLRWLLDLGFVLPLPPQALSRP